MDAMTSHVAIDAFVVSVHQVSLNQRNFYHVGKECILLIQHLSGLNCHLHEKQLLELKNTIDSCVLYLDYIPEKLFVFIMLIESFLSTQKIGSPLFSLNLTMHCMMDLPFASR